MMINFALELAYYYYAIKLVVFHLIELINNYEYKLALIFFSTFKSLFTIIFIIVIIIIIIIIIISIIISILTKFIFLFRSSEINLFMIIMKII